MPDLNTVPASPHQLAGSRRQSNTQTLPPHLQSAPRRESSTQVPTTDPSLHVLPSNQSTVNQSRRTSEASQPSPFIPTPGSDRDNGGIAGPGPIRHPRALTPAELHIQLEKEQEAVVNRLTRELQLLRAANNASTVSNTSSTSGNTPVDHPTPSDSGLMSGGFSIPSSTSRRHNRTSSSTSARSIRSNAATAGSASLTSTAQRALGTSPSWDHVSTTTYFHGSNRSTSSQGQTQGELSPGLLSGTTRYEETIHNRDLLDAALQENETLKQRIRELERLLRERRRSDSGSTAVSAGISTTDTAGSSVAAYRQRPLVTRERSIASAVSVSGSGVSEFSGLSTRSIAGSSVTGRLNPDDDEDDVDFGESASTAGQALDVDHPARQ
ncbi:hypothetical protein F5X68DRAFT_47700 [Plectosphaerella plurivora]|uniref:Uncharacterized protein n=1 Tax=Plectosphaerella plurivora TaxID=936078 RepID=A0A9P8VJL8_9PEZI|nr:hypothetical protein F5X68DRAFT_47700 [Plectosphaerella plurivora]